MDCNSSFSRSVLGKKWEVVVHKTFLRLFTPLISLSSQTESFCSHLIPAAPAKARLGRYSNGIDCQRFFLYFFPLLTHFVCRCGELFTCCLSEILYNKSRYFLRYSEDSVCVNALRSHKFQLLRRSWNLVAAVAVALLFGVPRPRIFLHRVNSRPTLNATIIVIELLANVLVLPVNTLIRFRDSRVQALSSQLELIWLIFAGFSSLVCPRPFVSLTIMWRMTGEVSWASQRWICLRR